MKIDQQTGIQPVFDLRAIYSPKKENPEKPEDYYRETIIRYRKIIKAGETRDTTVLTIYDPEHYDLVHSVIVYVPS